MSTLTAAVTATWAYLCARRAFRSRPPAGDRRGQWLPVVVRAGDSVDAALEADGAGVDGAGVDVVEDVAGGVVVAGAGVAFGEPGLIEADLADVFGVVVGQGAGEQGFG